MDMPFLVAIVTHTVYLYPFVPRDSELRSKSTRLVIIVQCQEGRTLIHSSVSNAMPLLTTDQLKVSVFKIIQNIDELILKRYPCSPRSKSLSLNIE